MKKEKTHKLPMKRKREPCLNGITYRIKTGCGSLFVIINQDDKGLYEVFSILGRSGSCFRAHIEAVCRLINVCLRTKAVPVEYIIEEMQGIRCSHPFHGENGLVLSCIDGLAKILKEHLEKQV